MVRSRSLTLGSLIFVLMVWMIPSCKHGKCKTGPDSNLAETSHNAGENCMRCHLPDGEGEYCWTVAGTVYDHAAQQPLSGTEVILFTGPLGTGNVQRILTSDATGNIHTSSTVSFGYGLFPAVVHNSDTAFMSMAIQDGACNRCHGSTTDRISIP